MTTPVSPVSAEEALKLLRQDIVDLVAALHSSDPLKAKLQKSLAATVNIDPLASGATPEGWRIVPKALRPAMDDAIDRALKLGSNQHIWDEALAAAPLPTDPCKLGALVGGVESKPYNLPTKFSLAKGFTMNFGCVTKDGKVKRFRYREGIDDDFIEVPDPNAGNDSKDLA